MEKIKGDVVKKKEAISLKKKTKKKLCQRQHLFHPLADRKRCLFTFTGVSAKKKKNLGRTRIRISMDETKSILRLTLLRN